MRLLLAVAWTWLPLSAATSTGSGTDASVIAGINRAVQLKSTYNIRVPNLSSLGRPIYASYKTDSTESLSIAANGEN